VIHGHTSFISFNIVKQDKEQICNKELFFCKIIFMDAAQQLLDL